MIFFFKKKTNRLFVACSVFKKVEQIFGIVVEQAAPASRVRIFLNHTSPMTDLSDRRKLSQEEEQARKEMQAAREALPIFAHQRDIVLATKARRCVIVVAETGSGTRASARPLLRSDS